MCRFCFFVLLLSSIFCWRVEGQNQGGETNAWRALERLPARPAADAWVQPKVFRAYELDPAQLRPLLAGAPHESSQAVAQSDAIISLPLPDGTFGRFRFVESPVMAPELAAKFPEIKTYLGRGIDDPAATVRFDITPAGFHAQILSPRGAVYIDPGFRRDAVTHVSYYKRDYWRPTADFQCLTPTGDALAQGSFRAPLIASGGQLRTYRLACAATGEYTQYHGGTVSNAMAAIVTAINRVTGVYETEVAIRLVLVGNNNLIVYTNGNMDPYSNNSGSTMLSQNQSNLDTVIGSGNYDIGHVFSTGGGGIAGLGVVCVSGRKANGVTGLSNPIGDGFYIDYVAHEMGHQFGANHPFNSTMGSCGGANRNASTAYEPGSGSTIMAYAGICGSDDLQPHSDPYFHSVSLDEILNYVATGAGSGCAVSTGTGNSSPTVDAGVNYTVPKSTPFALTATGSDPDGDTLAFCWEERDLGPATTLTAPDNGSSPLFRSFSPTFSAVRTFPRLSDLLDGTMTLGEMLPTTSRTLHFRVVARDNRSAGGGINSSDMQVTVVTNAGPFVVTSPNTNVTWYGARTVTWNVAGTTNVAVNAVNVNILLSTDGGLSFPVMLATNVPNDGVQLVSLPDIVTSTARIKVEAAGNIFFDVSDVDFVIAPPAPLIVLEGTAVMLEGCAPGNGAVDPAETVTMNFTLRNTGTADTTNLVAALLATNGVLEPSGSQEYGAVLAGGGSVTRAFTFSAAGLCGGSISPVLQLSDGSTNVGTVSQVMQLGAPVTNVYSLTNIAAITIPAPGDTRGSGSPYPSTISVTGMTGMVTKVTVRLNGLTHASPDDIDAVLVGPQGQSVLLMSDAGSGTAASNLFLTFDDAAASNLPNSGAIVSGTYKPTNFDTVSDSFVSPAPAGPFGQILSLFNGLDPNGTWSLYVQDDSKQNVGNLAQGWTLAITTSNTTCCTPHVPAADLVLTMQVSPPSVEQGQNLTYTFGLTNVGPDSATNAVITNLLPAGVSFVSLSTSQGSWTNDNGLISVALGDLTNGVGAVVSFSVTPTNVGTFTNYAGVNALTPDPNVTNNSAFAIATVVPTNSMPFLHPISNYVVYEGETLVVTNIVTDPDVPPQILTFGMTNAPAGASINTTNGLFTWTPLEAQGPMTNVFTIYVQDDGTPSLSSTQTFTVTVLESNSAPILTAIADRTVHAGTVLTISNVAVDLDIPANLLTFSLGTNAPEGATLDSAAGLFSWATTAADVDTTNLFTIRVEDDGSPLLSDVKSFTVTVVARAMIDLISVSNELVTVSWSAIPQQSYQLEYSEDLSGTNWVGLLPQVTATNVTAFMTDTVGETIQRFYRVRLWP
jgi:uncharacterized repeat protein (TIGR01451 family)